MNWMKRYQSYAWMLLLAAGVLLLSGAMASAEGADGAPVTADDTPHTITVKRECTDGYMCLYIDKSENVFRTEDQFALTYVGVNAEPDSTSTKMYTWNYKTNDTVQKITAAAGTTVKIRFVSSTHTTNKFYSFLLDRWETQVGSAKTQVSGAKTNEDGILEFTMPDDDVEVTCYYKKDGVKVTFGSIDDGKGDAISDNNIQINGGNTTCQYRTYGKGEDVFKKGSVIKITPGSLAAYGFDVDVWEYKGWKKSPTGTLYPWNEVKDEVGANNQTLGIRGKKGAVQDSNEIKTYYPYFTVSESCSWYAVYHKIAFATLSVSPGNATMGTVACTVGETTGTAAEDGAITMHNVKENTEIQLTATPKEGYEFVKWKAKAGAALQALPFKEGSQATDAATTLIMPNTGEDLMVEAEFKKIPSKLCAVSDITLTGPDGRPMGRSTTSGTSTRFDLTADDLSPAEAEKLGTDAGYRLSLEYSDDARVQYVTGGAQTAWAKSGEGMAEENTDLATNTCPIGINQKGTFRVVAENGEDSREYTVGITYTPLALADVQRISRTEAQVTVMAPAGGKYYHTLVKQGAEEPKDADYVTGEGEAVPESGSLTFTVTLDTGEPYDLYMQAKGTDAVLNTGDELSSNRLKVEIPVYVPVYKVNVSCPAGGTLTVSPGAAKAGDRVKVTVAPGPGMRFLGGSLKYTKAEVSFLLRLKGRRGAGGQLRFAGLLFLLSAAGNPLLSHRGLTKIGTLFGQWVTLEALCYGVASGLSLAALILWFACWQEVMTGDKLLYLLGRAAPSSALLATMSLQLIEKLRLQLKQIQECQRMAAPPGHGVMGRLRAAIRHTSALLGWSVESAVEQADSMKARGYGIRRRTAFHLFCFDCRDRRFLGAALLLGGACVAARVAGYGTVEFYPGIRNMAPGAGEWVFFGVYGLFVLLPAILEIREALRWRSYGLNQ